MTRTSLEVVVLVCLIGCGQPAPQGAPINPPPVTQVVPPPVAPPVSTPANQGAQVSPATDQVIKVNAVEFVGAGSADPNAAFNKYGAASVELSGTVYDVMESNNVHWVFVEGPSAADGDKHIPCVTKDQLIFGKIAKGQQITLRGKVSSGNCLIECDVVQSGPPPFVVESATEFAEQWRVSGLDGAEKWNAKPIVFIGKVEEVQIDTAGVATVQLATDSKVRLRCVLHPSESNKLYGKNLKKGDEVQLTSVFYAFDAFDVKAGADLVTVKECYPASPMVNFEVQARAPVKTIKITAEEFAVAVKEDQQAGTSRFENAVVEITGIVEAMTDSSGDGTNVVFLTPGVICQVTTNLFGKVGKGQQITLRCNVRNGSTLVLGEVVSLGASTVQTYTAVDLGQAWAKDKESTIAKLKGKTVLVSGEIESIEFNEGAAAKVRLKSSAGRFVECRFNDFEMGTQFVKTLKKGQKVTLVGDFSEFGDSPAIQFCRPVTTP